MISTENRSYIITAVLAIAVATGVRYFIHRWRQPPPSCTILVPNDTESVPRIDAIKTRQSRLLRKQFGILEDDLQLYEETIVANDDVAVVNKDSQGNIHFTSSEIESEADDGEFGTPVTINHHGDISISQDPQNSSDSVATSETTVLTPQSAKKDKKIRLQSQYERLQQYRREQMLISAEFRLERQRQIRSRPPLFHFWNWYDAQTSLYRQYTFVRNDGVEDSTTIVPYHPSSRRSDKISIQLRVTNDLDIPISVYWIDHIGKHVPKGIILARGGYWQQTTYVDHPWIFKTTSSGDDNNSELSDSLDGNTERILLHYIPHQVIPSTMDTPTVDDEIGSATGIHRFHIVPPAAAESTVYNCTVRDPILPFPASHYIFSARKAAEFALQHCIRMRYDRWSILQAYIGNIIDNPNELKYQSIRIANPKFSDSVWNTPAKGVLLAYNFIEQSDTGYVSFGGNIHENDKNNEDDDQKVLSIETVQELRLLLHMIQVTERKAMIEFGDQ